MKPKMYIIALLYAFCFASFGVIVPTGGLTLKTENDASKICPGVCQTKSMQWEGKGYWMMQSDSGPACICFESCNHTSDCSNASGLGQQGIACCANRCTEKKKDWAGVWYCPEECRGAPFAVTGSC